MKFIKYYIIAAATLAFTSCGSDNNDEPEVAADLTVVSAQQTQVLDNDVYSSTEVSFEFSENVTYVATTPITVDGSAITVTPTVSGKKVTMNLYFESESTHTITIGRYSFKGTSGSFLAKAYDYTFTTSKKPESSFDALSNAKATTQTQNVYNYLIQQNGKKILSGAMANVNNNNDFAKWIYSLTQKQPALACYDFIHLPYSGQNWINYSDISPAQTQWNNNGLVAYMWHWLTPSSKEDWDNKAYTKYGYYFNNTDKNVVNTSFDIREALTEGTWQHDFILADIDKVAAVFKQLQDAGIPVLWRPLHEAAGDYGYGAWFWWGRYGVEYTKQLWTLMYDRMVNYHGLNNIIWVWTAQTTDSGKTASLSKIKEAYPGDEYVDIVGADIYASSDDSQIDIYKLLRQLTGGKKLITISETGYLQSPDKCITEGAAWSYFMLWYTNDIHKSGATKDDFGNTATNMAPVFNSSYVINRDQMPSLK